MTYTVSSGTLNPTQLNPQIRGRSAKVSLGEPLACWNEISRLDALSDSLKTMWRDIAVLVFLIF